MSQAVSADALLVEELAMRHYFNPMALQLPPTECAGTSSEKCVGGYNPEGPDRVLGNVLKACADQFLGVLMRISQKQSTLPPCLKVGSCLNEYRPVALNSVVGKYI